ncbi:MAG: hypothetical protein H6574_07190 [Lewinellaceae bacterium]|nr:hypothetical protein [Saprospiraceae bacterium]MCB9330847.1 hypothetical protein [Lewinellaceae bacterium]
MKSLTIYGILLALLASLAGGISACKKDDTTLSEGLPVVHYVRSTDPGKSDSLLVGSFMGSLIAIVGENLKSTRALWFNDQQAVLNPAYITNTTILVNVPSTVPSEVTDKMRFVTADGSEYLYDFKVNVPAPEITSTKCEYVPDGGTMILYGDFFFDPKVIFPGDLEGEITLAEKTKIEVTVPAGAGVGPITVQTNFGKAKSRFYFRDDRNIILDYDVKIHETWTAPIESANPSGCSGKFAHFKNSANGAWQWANELTMQYWAPRGRGNVPVAVGSKDDLVFKFECNVPSEWRDVRMEIFFGPYAEDHGRDLPGTAIARWQPWKSGPYKTDGWITVSIPLSEFKYGKDDPADDPNGTKSLGNLATLTNVTMMLFGPAEGTNPVDIAFDNVRIVPKD